MFFLKRFRRRAKFKAEKSLIEREISQAKRFGENFSVVSIEMSHSAPRGLSKLLPGRTMSFHVLEKNIRLYDQLINCSFRKYFLILSKTDAKGVKAVKERIRSLSEKHNWGDVSIASATYPIDGETSNDLLGLL